MPHHSTKEQGQAVEASHKGFVTFFHQHFLDVAAVVALFAFFILITQLLTIFLRTRALHNDVKQYSIDDADDENERDADFFQTGKKIANLDASSVARQQHGASFQKHGQKEISHRANGAASSLLVGQQWLGAGMLMIPREQLNQQLRSCVRASRLRVVRSAIILDEG